jgi:hypothetical protein
MTSGAMYSARGRETVHRMRRTSKIKPSVPTNELVRTSEVHGRVSTSGCWSGQSGWHRERHR